MKKIIAFLIFISTVCSLNAQTYKYKTNSFAYKLYENNRWSNWSEWQESNMLVVISLDRDVINIYSDKMQEYDIIDYSGEQKDDSGGTSLVFQCVDREGLRCQIRVRMQTDGYRQLYVDYNDMTFVYGIDER